MLWENPSSAELLAKYEGLCRIGAVFPGKRGVSPMSFVRAFRVFFLPTGALAFLGAALSCAHTPTIPLALVQTVASECQSQVDSFFRKQQECGVYSQQRGSAMSDEINCIGRIKLQREQKQAEGEKSSYYLGTSPVRFQLASYDIIIPQKPDLVPPSDPPITRYPECKEFSKETDQKIKLVTDCNLELSEAHRTGLDCIREAARKYKEQHPESKETLPEPPQTAPSPSSTSQDT